MSKNVSNEKFVVIWQKAESLAEVVQKTGMTNVQASNRASFLRLRHSVPLKHFARGNEPVDAPTLIKLARESIRV